MTIPTQDENRTMKSPHNLVVEERNKLTATGVSNVDSFNEETIVAYTSQGELTIRGSNLTINHLNVETGELTVDGKITSMTYTENQPRTAGFFSKLFR